MGVSLATLGSLSLRARPFGLGAGPPDSPGARVGQAPRFGAHSGPANAWHKSSSTMFQRSVGRVEKKDAF